MKEKVRLDMVLKTDPETQEQYWTRERVTVYKAEASDRINAVLDILKGVTTAEEVQKKYDITSINSVYIWIGKYVSQEKSLSLEEQTYEDMATKSKDDQIRELKAQLKQARKEAELEKLRAHAYDTMINLAEEKFNIPIRKKSGTKQ
jgi:transposase-like protein